jgi:hypothetical protein
LDSDISWHCNNRVVANLQVRARGKVTADVMESLVGAAYVTHPNTRRLTTALLARPPEPAGACGGSGGADQGAGEGGGASLALRLHAAGVCGVSGPAGEAAAAPPLPLAPGGLLQAARMCVNIGLLPPGEWGAWIGEGTQGRI